jgi:hypothetical protein
MSGIIHFLVNNRGVLNVQMIKLSIIKVYRKELYLMSTQELLSPILSFLKCETPQTWVDEAVKPENLENLLIDHCNCELKA